MAGALALVVLTGCVMGGGTDGSDAAANKAPRPNPILQGEIVTATLDDFAPAAPAAAPTSPEPAPADPAPDPEPAAAVPPEPVVPQSPAETKCLKSGGSWAAAGASGAKACVKLTKDGGKACSRQSQCEGYCLARSRTCAPITPMFGCNDIVQDDGREVSLCID